MKHNLNLNWLRTFDAAARHLSFTAASYELGLTQTAVSQHIKALEAKLGQNLFIRYPKSLQLTDIGQAYLISVRNALEHIEFSTSGLFGPELEVTIVVRASAAMIIWLSSKIFDFQNENPHIGVKFVTSLWQNKLEKHPVDVDILLASKNQTDQRMIKLSDEKIVPVCGIQTSKKIFEPSDLIKYNPIHIMGFDDHWARYLTANGLPTNARNPLLFVDTSVAACELVAAENGCAIMIERFAQQAIKTGRPIKIVGDPVATGQSHYLVQRNINPSEKYASLAFCKWLSSCIK